MARLYQNTVLIIAAIKSQDGTGGLYSKPTRQKNLYPDGLWIRERNPHFEPGKDWPLLKRGWVFQERWLSRRVVHFGAEDVTWECKPHRRSQHHTLLEELESEKLEDVSIAWRKHVNDYTKLDFTFETDRLMALSGMMENAVVLRLGDRYMARPWEKTLLHDLQWERSSKIQPRPAKFRAPTWSWASIDSSVAWDETLDGGNPPSLLQGVLVQNVSCPTSYTGTRYGDDDAIPSPTTTIRGILIAVRFLSPRAIRWATEEDADFVDERITYCSVLGLAPEHISDSNSLSTARLHLSADYLFTHPATILYRQHRNCCLYCPFPRAQVTWSTIGVFLSVN